MSKLWLVLILIAGTAGVAALALRNRGPVSGSLGTPAAPSTAFVSSAVDTTLPDRGATAAPPALPGIEDRVAGLSAAIWNELNSSSNDGHETVFTHLLPELIALDPVAAARLVDATTIQQGREELLRQLIQTWTAKDVTAAFAWIEQLADGDEQQRALLYAIRQMAQTDPETAAAAAVHLTYPQTAVMGDIALTWAGKDLAAALSWAIGQPDGEQRDAIMARIAFVESRTAPEAAANLVVEEIPPGAAQEEAAISVLHQWALQNFQAARIWADRFPSGPFLDRALRELSGIASKTAGRTNELAPPES